MILTLYLINLYNIFFDFKVRKNTYPKKACNYKKVCKKMFIDNIKKLNYTLRCSLLQNWLIKKLKHTFIVRNNIKKVYLIFVKNPLTNCIKVTR